MKSIFFRSSFKLIKVHNNKTKKRNKIIMNINNQFKKDFLQSKTQNSGRK